MDLSFNLYFSIASEPTKFFTITNCLYLLNTIVTAGIGIWIGVSFKKNYESTKSAKDYFIAQSTSISTEYDAFMTSLCDNKLSCVEIQTWFKRMSLKIKDYEKFLGCEFEINSEVLKKHNIFKRYLTGTDTFNESFSKKTLTLSADLKSIIYTKHSAVSNAFSQLVIDIIKAKRNKTWSKRVKK